jgi:hypothetical protein
MALKRTSKSLGKPVGKPMTSVVRHVDVRTKQQMIAGTMYEGWLCKNKACGLVIAIAAPPPGSKPAPPEPEDRLVALKCPHCADEDLYRWNTRAQHKFEPKGAAPVAEQRA